MEDLPSHVLWRMDWGFGNPNKTAALIALIMTAVWALSYVRKGGFWVALGLFTGFGAGLILTQSRGGLVGALAGSLILLVFAPRPFPFRRSVAVLLTCAGLTLFAFAMKAESRYTQGIIGKDLSIGNRLLIWEQVPAMIHDAPNGWGLGRSGEAYMQWYQPLNRGEGYRTLVNSHLTWLVELDWPGRIVYVFAWVAVFILLWPPAGFRWFSVPLGIWGSLAVCASFSSVAEAPSLWVIPVLALVAVLVTRRRHRSWPRTDIWLCGAGGACVLLGGIWGSVFIAGNRSMVHCPQPGVVVLGDVSPSIWLVAPSRKVLGEHFGHVARREFASNPVFKKSGFGIIGLLKNAPPGQTLIVSGPIPLTWGASSPTDIILIDPALLSPDAMGALIAYPRITVIVGEFSQNKAYWSRQGQKYLNLKMQMVMGSEDYIPDWMDQIAHAITSQSF